MDYKFDLKKKKKVLHSNYPNNLLRNILVIDPHISYEALKDKFDDDYTMLNQPEESKKKLQAHFNAKYPDPIWNFTTFIYPVLLHAICDLRFGTHHLAN